MLHTVSVAPLSLYIVYIRESKNVTRMKRQWRVEGLEMLGSSLSLSLYRDSDAGYIGRMNERLNRTEQPSKNTRNLLVSTREREREINKETKKERERESRERETYSYASSDYTRKMYVCMYVCISIIKSI